MCPSVALRWTAASFAASEENIRRIVGYVQLWMLKAALDDGKLRPKQHLNHVCRQWRLHYNGERPHDAQGHLPPELDQQLNGTATYIDCSSRLSGLLDTYSRRAA